MSLGWCFGWEPSEALLGDLHDAILLYLYTLLTNGSLHSSYPIINSSIMAPYQSKLVEPTRRGYDHYAGTGRVGKSYRKHDDKYGDTHARDREVIKYIYLSGDPHYEKYQLELTKEVVKEKGLTNESVKAQDLILRRADQLQYFADRLRNLAANFPLLESQGADINKVNTGIGIIASKSGDLMADIEKMIGQAVEKQVQDNKDKAYKVEMAMLWNR